MTFSQYIQSMYAYTVCATRKWKQYIGNLAEMTRFEEMMRVYCREREEKIMVRKNDLRDLIYEEDGIGVVEIILILVVLIMLVVIFRKQITGIVSSAFSNINEDSETINEDIELDE